MMNRVAFVLGVTLVVVFSAVTFAAVWDEPWHREIVLGADSFGLYDAVNATPFTTTFKRVRGLAGADTGDAVTVDGSYGSTTPLVLAECPHRGG